MKGVKIDRYLRNYPTNCGQIWCVFRDQVAVHVTQVMDRVHLQLHVHTRAYVCPLFLIWETAGRVALKFDVWLEAF